MMGEKRDNIQIKSFLILLKFNKLKINDNKIIIDQTEVNNK